MDKIWWKHIIKANKFIDDVVSAAMGGKSIILSLPENTPWRKTMIDMISDRLKFKSSSRLFEEILCPEEEVGLYLLNNYCKKEKRATYRYGMTYASFLGKSQDIVLNDRFIWVSNVPSSRYEEWVDFITEYTSSVTEKDPAIFILEVSDRNTTYKPKKGIRVISFEQNIGAYDRFAFSALLATEIDIKDYIRPYLAELASIVCNEDIELCAECVSSGYVFLENPLEVIHSIIKVKNRSDGRKFDFTKDNSQIEKLIWETQLKHVFPLIEKYKRNFILRHESAIKSALPITNSYGESVESPIDVEIGTLLYMIKQGLIPINEAEYSELKNYRAARNKLAHLDILDLDIVDMILKKSKVFV